MTEIKCPHCGKVHYTEDYHTSTAMGWSAIVKDGVRYDEDPNIHTTHCTCLECGAQFAISTCRGKTTVDLVSAPKPTSHLEEPTPELNCYGEECNLTWNSYTLENSIQPHEVIIDCNTFDHVIFKYKGNDYKFDTEKLIDFLCSKVV